MRLKETRDNYSVAVCQHLSLLGHRGYGVTELRTFDIRPMVAYIDNELSAARLCRQVNGRVSGIYVGVQPRPIYLFDKAPNCWKPATLNPESNCACDRDIEYLTACFWDIDVVSAQRDNGHPASQEELLRSYHAAESLCKQECFEASASICCSGNGHYVLAPIVPIPVYDNDVAMKFRCLCQQLADEIGRQLAEIKIDPVYNLGRVMRLMGTINRKGQATTERPHRRAHFMTAPIPTRSVALHYMILSADIPEFSAETNRPHSENIRCNIAKIKTCEFINWCRRHPMRVSEPQWFAMITNLAFLEGGPEIVHEISRLDKSRYDYQQTQRLIRRVLTKGYGPVSCERIKSLGFNCRKFGSCYARAPMYTTDLFPIWKR